MAGDCVEEELLVAFDLKDASALVGGGGDEVCAGDGGASGDRHAESAPQGLKPLCLCGLFSHGLSRVLNGAVRVYANDRFAMVHVAA